MAKAQPLTPVAALHGAVGAGNLGILGEVIKRYPDMINVKNKNGNTPLHRAVQNLDLGAMRVLIRNNVDVNVQNNRSQTPLHVAVIHSNSGKIRANSVIELLINARADLHLFDNNSAKPIHYAILQGNLVATKMLIEYENDMNTMYDKGNLLHTAVTYCYSLEIIKLIIKKGVNVCNTDPKGRSPLHIVAANDNKLMVDARKRMETLPDAKIQVVNKRYLDAFLLLLGNGANAMTLDPHEQSTMHAAAKGGNIEILKLLLAKCRTLGFQRDRYRCKPIYYSIINGHREATAILLDLESNISYVCEFGTLLHGAVSNCYSIDIIKVLLDRGIDVESVNKKGRTALHAATRNSHIIMVDARDRGETVSDVVQDKIDKMYVEVVRLLINKGANIYATDFDKQSVFHSAAKGGNVEIIKILLDKDKELVHLEDKWGCKPLYHAILHGKVEATKLLLELDDNINYVCERGSLLHAAANNCYSMEILEMLIARGIDIEAVDHNERTALHIAATNTHIVMIDARDRFEHVPERVLEDINKQYAATIARLLELGVKINVKDKNGQTPLHSAARGGNVEVLNLLLGKDRNLIKESDIFGQTALHSAAEVGQPSAVKFLTKLGTCDIDARNKDHEHTALHLAVSHKQCNKRTRHRCQRTQKFCFGMHNECVKILLQMGADVNPVDLHGYTPQSLAERIGNQLAVDILKQFAEGAVL